VTGSIDTAALRSASDQHGPARALDSLGRIVIPAEVRRQLALTAGDQLAITMTNGNITLTPLRGVCSECGRPT
jgi:AbrB family looped-hinge helix DNA binding protein